jgi:hypothetical protein
MRWAVVVVVWCCWNIAAVLQDGGRAREAEPAGSRTPGNPPPRVRTRRARRRTHRACRVDVPVEGSGGRQAQDALVAFLQAWPWEWCCTLTFRASVHPEAADKRFRRFVMQLNRDLYGRRWLKHGQGLRWVRTLECQRRGVLHYHVLFAGVSDLRPHDCARIWNDLAGFARIEPIRDMTAVLRYLSKDVHRGGELEFEPRMRAP